MKSKHFFSAMVLCAAALTLSGCGGGGTSADAGGTSASISSNSVTVGSTTIQAGTSTSLNARVIVRGTTPNSMVWTVAPIDVVSASDARPQVGDVNCSTATFAPPIVAGTSGEGSCQTILTIPTDTKAGTWRITNTAKTESGISVSNSVTIAVTAQPANGFRLLESSAPVYGYTNQMLTLSMPFTVNPGSAVSDVRYNWKAAAENPTILAIAGSRNSVASVVPMIHGQYRFDVEVTAKVNGFDRQATGSVIAIVNPPNFVDILNAGAPLFVATNQAATLTGTVLNRDDTLVYIPVWRQVEGIQGGPTRVDLLNANSYNPSFVATVPGTYQFEFQITKRQADGKEVISTTKTAVVVQFKSAAGFGFTASAGDAKTSAINTPVTLNSSVTAQGGTTDVTYSYQWSQLSGPTVQISNSRAPTASFIPTVAGEYTFNLNVTAKSEGGSSTVSATTQVSVPAGGTSTNQGFALTANAGPAQTLSTNSVAVLTGSQSTQGDASGVTYAYRWTQTSGPTLTLANASSTQTSFLPTISGKYGFTFEVTATLPNGTTRVATADTQVTIGNIGTAFSVSAGDAQKVELNTPTILLGNVSTQGMSAGETLAYQWEQVGTTPSAVTVSNANSLSASFIPTAIGTYTFRLAVTVTNGGTAEIRYATTQVLVTPIP